MSCSVADFGTKFARWLQPRQKILIAAHERPDGDAYGSVYAMLRSLQAQGYVCQAYFAASLPAQYTQLLPALAEIVVGNTVDLDFDGLICLDTTGYERLQLPTAARAYVESANVSVCNIDHHPDNARFGDLFWIVADRAATAQALAELFAHLHYHVDAETAGALLIGLIMDTGGFRFANTTAQVLAQAAQLTAAGADLHRIMDQMFFRKSYNLQLLEGKILEQASFACNNQVLYAVLSPELLAQCGVQSSETEGLIDRLRSVDGVEITALLQPQADGEVRISLRGRSHAYPVNEIAHAFDGGGHRLAAGARITGLTLQQITRKLLQLAAPIVEKAKS